MYIKALDPEGPMITSFEFLKDMVFLNLLTLLCCIPVITIVPAISACHYTALKIVRDENGYVSKEFFRSFKMNLKQGIFASLLMLLAAAFILADYYAITLMDVWFADAGAVLLLILSFVFVFTLTFFFPVFAKFEAGLTDNIKNAFKMALSHPFMTLLMIIINLLPFAICYFVNFLIPLLLILAFSLPAYFDAKLYEKIFAKLEGREEKSGEEE